MHQVYTLSLCNLELLCYNVGSIYLRGGLHGLGRSPFLKHFQFKAVLKMDVRLFKCKMEMSRLICKVLENLECVN